MILEFSRLWNSNFLSIPPLLDELEYEHVDELSHGLAVLHGARLVLFVKLHVPDL